MDQGQEGRRLLAEAEKQYVRRRPQRGACCPAAAGSCSPKWTVLLLLLLLRCGDGAYSFCLAVTSLLPNVMYLITFRCST